MSPALRARRSISAAHGAAIAATAERGVGSTARRQRPRLERHAQRLHAVVAADVEDFGQYRGMQMIVLMRVDMIEGEPGRSEGLELRANLGANLAAHGGSHHDRKPIGGKIGAQTP